jgi:hypothetical protein
MRRAFGFRPSPPPPGESAGDRGNHPRFCAAKAVRFGSSAGFLPIGEGLKSGWGDVAGFRANDCTAKLVLICRQKPQFWQYPYDNL